MSKDDNSATDRDTRSIRVVGRTFGTLLILVLTGLVLYMGIGICVAVISTNRDAQTVFGVIGYVCVALVFPAILARRGYKRRGWTRTEAVQMGAVWILIVNVLLLPIGLTILGGM